MSGQNAVQGQLSSFKTMGDERGAVMPLARKIVGQHNWV